jgi:CO/xanthine dehydrogenase Mo-binding subunit
MGDPVAAVAAESEEIADRALELIDVKYEELPAVFDPKEALKPRAPQIHPSGNLCFHRKIRKGDVEKGFREADKIIEDSLQTPWQEHASLEPHGGVAMVDAKGKLTVWSSNQSPFIFQGYLSSVLKMPAHKIRVIQTACGGGFGGKIEMSIEPHIALLALKTRRPVKMIWTREDEFIASTVRHRWFIEYKTGVKRDGTITAIQAKIIVDNGPYINWGESHMTKGSIFACGPYNIPNVKVDAYLVYTNTIFSGAVRGFGVVQITAARESHLDNVARRLEMDPIELRLKNIVKDGDTTATGQVLHGVGVRETVLAAAKAAGWQLGEGVSE